MDRAGAAVDEVALARFLCITEKDDNNAVFNLCCRLCVAYEHKAFLDGLNMVLSRCWSYQGKSEVVLQITQHPRIYLCYSYCYSPPGGIVWCHLAACLRAVRMG